MNVSFVISYGIYFEHGIRLCTFHILIINYN